MSRLTDLKLALYRFIYKQRPSEDIRNSEVYVDEIG